MWTLRSSELEVSPICSLMSEIYLTSLMPTQVKSWPFM